jgi:hypothetical protein
MRTVEAIARDVADELGRDWIDCGEYERESYRDEARQRLDSETAEQSIRDFLIAVDRGYLGQMPPGFNESAFVAALRRFQQ